MIRTKQMMNTPKTTKTIQLQRRSKRKYPSSVEARQKIGTNVSIILMLGNAISHIETISNLQIFGIELHREGASIMPQQGLTKPFESFEQQTGFFSICQCMHWLHLQSVDLGMNDSMADWMQNLSKPIFSALCQRLRILSTELEYDDLTIHKSHDQTSAVVAKRVDNALLDGEFKVKTQPIQSSRLP